MFTKILIANRGVRDAGAVAVAAATKCLVRDAHASDFDPIEQNHV